MSSLPTHGGEPTHPSTPQIMGTLLFSVYGSCPHPHLTGASGVGELHEEVFVVLDAEPTPRTRAGSASPRQDKASPHWWRCQVVGAT